MKFNDFVTQKCIEALESAERIGCQSPLPEEPIIEDKELIVVVWGDFRSGKNNKKFQSIRFSYTLPEDVITLPVATWVDDRGVTKHTPRTSEKMFRSEATEVFIKFVDEASRTLTV